MSDDLEARRRKDWRSWTAERTAGHAYDRYTTPENYIVFAFKGEPTDEQLQLVDTFAFFYDPEKREAKRPNDAWGRDAADELDHHLGTLARDAGRGR